MYINEGITALLNAIVPDKRPMKVAFIAEPFTETQAQIPPASLIAKQ